MTYLKDVGLTLLCMTVAMAATYLVSSLIDAAHKRYGKRMVNIALVGVSGLLFIGGQFYLLYNLLGNDPLSKGIDWFIGTILFSFITMDFALGFWFVRSIDTFSQLRKIGGKFGQTPNTRP